MNKEEKANQDWEGFIKKKHKKEKLKSWIHKAMRVIYWVGWGLL